MDVLFYAAITRYTRGEKSFTPKEHSTLRGVLDELCVHYGEEFESFIYASEKCIFLINGQGVMMSGGLDSPVCFGDKIEIIPFVDAG